MYSIAAWMECSIKIIIVTLKERIIETTFFGNKNTTAGKITQSIDDCKISCQNKYNNIQRMNACYSFCGKNRCLTPKDG